MTRCPTPIMILVISQTTPPKSHSATHISRPISAALLSSASGFVNLATLNGTNQTCYLDVVLLLPAATTRNSWVARLLFLSRFRTTPRTLLFQPAHDDWGPGRSAANDVASAQLGPGVPVISGQRRKTSSALSPSRPSRATLREAKSPGLDHGW